MKLLDPRALQALIVAATTLVVTASVSVPAIAQASRPASPAQVRATEAQLQAKDARIAQLEATTGVSSAALQRIWTIFELTGENLSFDEKLRQLEILAMEAAGFQAAQVELEAKTELLARTDMALRSFVLPALERSRVAFDEGRLEDAEAELNQFLDLAPTAYRPLWADAVGLLVRIDRVRGRWDEAWSRSAEAQQEYRRTIGIVGADQTIELELAHLGATTRHLEWRITGRRAALEVSVREFEDTVIPLTTPNTVQWAAAKTNYSTSARSLAALTGDSILYDRAVSAALEVLPYLSTLPNAGSYLYTARTLADALASRGDENGSLEDLRKAVSIYETISVHQAVDEALRAEINIGYSNALASIGARSEDRTMLMEARQLLWFSIEHYRNRGDVLSWAMSVLNRAQIDADMCLIFEDARANCEMAVADADLVLSSLSGLEQSPLYARAFRIKGEALLFYCDMWGVCTRNAEAINALQEARRRYVDGNPAMVRRIDLLLGMVLETP